MNGSFVALALALALACSSTPALSADATVTSGRGNRFNVEVKPLALIVNLVPGSHGFSGGLEVPFGEHVAAFGTASFLSFKLPDSAITESTDKDAPPKTTMKEITTGAAHGGLRYYGQVSSDSWYAGAGVGAGNSRIEWLHDGETLIDKTVLFTTGIEAGYRWLWNSGFLMRVGAQLSANNLRNRSISAVSTAVTPSSQAVDDVTKEGQQPKTQLSTGFDFGVGWAF